MQNAQLHLGQTESPEFSDIPCGKLRLNDCTGVVCGVEERDDLGVDTGRGWIRLMSPGAVMG